MFSYIVYRKVSEFFNQWISMTVRLIELLAVNIGTLVKGSDDGFAQVVSTVTDTRGVTLR